MSLELFVIVVNRILVSALFLSKFLITFALLWKNIQKKTFANRVWIIHKNMANL